MNKAEEEGKLKALNSCRELVWVARLERDWDVI
jgi:hypothetical protein